MKNWSLGYPSVAVLFALGSVAFAQDLDVQAISRSAATVVEPPFEIYFVPSSGFLANATFRTLSKTNGPSTIAKQLAAELRKPRAKLRTIVVAGPSDGKTKQVLLDALKLLEDEPQPNLRLVFVGNAKIASEIEPIITVTGAEFKTAPK